MILWNPAQNAYPDTELGKTYCMWSSHGPAIGWLPPRSNHPRCSMEASDTTWYWMAWYHPIPYSLEPYHSILDYNKRGNWYVAMYQVSDDSCPVYENSPRHDARGLFVSYIWWVIGRLRSIAPKTYSHFQVFVHKVPQVSAKVMKRSPIARSCRHGKFSPTSRRSYSSMLFTPLERPTLPQETFN